MSVAASPIFYTTVTNKMLKECDNVRLVKLTLFVDNAIDITIFKYFCNYTQLYLLLVFV